MQRIARWRYIWKYNGLLQLSLTMQQESDLKRRVHGRFHDVVGFHEGRKVVSRHLVDLAFI